MRRTFSVVFLCVLMGLSAPVFAQGTGKTNNHAAANSVGSLEIDEAQDGTYIRVHGTSDPTFSVFKLTNPLRLFVDISGTQLDGDAITKRVGNGVISKVALIDFDENSQSVARLIIGFDTAAHYDVKADGNDVVVFVDGDKRRKSPKNVAKLQDKLDQVESKYRAKLDNSEQRYEKAMGQLGATRGELEATERKLEQLRVEMTEASGEQRSRLASKIARQSELLKETKAEITRREKKVAQLKGNLGKLRTERDQALAKARKLERERQAALAQAHKAQKESTQARQRAQKLAGELDKTRRALDSVASEKDQLKNRLDTMAQQAQQSSKKVDAQLAKLDAAKQRQQQLESQISTLRASLSKGNESVRSELEKIEQEKTRLSKRLESQLSSLEKARTEAQSANERVASLQQLVDAREAEVTQLRRELEQARAQSNKSQRAQDKTSQNDAEMARLKALRAKLDAEQERVASLEKKRLAEQKRLAELAERRERAKQELSETEGQIEARRQELEGIRSREDLPAAKAVAINPNETNHVRDIRLETRQGRSRIVVELDRPSNFETLPWKDSRAVMILNGVELPEKLQRTLAPDAQGGAVRFVSSYTDDSGKVRMEAELGQDASEVIRQEGNKVVWEFAPRMAANNQAAGTDQLAANGEPRRTDDGQSFTSAPPNYPRTVADPTKVNTVPGMKRKRLTIDLRQADIQNVLRLLAKEGGVNIITGDGVSGSVTMRLRSVPLDQVFLTILQSQGLGFEVRGLSLIHI